MCEPYLAFVWYLENRLHHLTRDNFSSESLVEHALFKIPLFHTIVLLASLYNKFKTLGNKENEQKKEHTEASGASSVVVDEWL